jgi:hypothetical protein
VFCTWPAWGRSSQQTWVIGMIGKNSEAANGTTLSKENLRKRETAQEQSF